MKDYLAVILFSGIFFHTTGCVASQSPSPTAESKISPSALLNAHNQHRLKVGAPKLNWSSELEQRATTWAKQLKKNGCFMKHSGPGENLFWASPVKTAISRKGSQERFWTYSLHQVSEQYVVNSWASEKKWFDPGANSCRAPEGKTCNHYTQVVWHNTKEIGCSKAVCDDFSQVWVCNYDPPGNIYGQKPY